MPEMDMLTPEGFQQSIVGPGVVGGATLSLEW